MGWSSRRVRWVWGVVVAGRAGVGGQAQHRHSQPRDAPRHGRAGSGPPSRSYGTMGAPRRIGCNGCPEQSAWRAMDAVRCDGDMARHIGTRSECASHQTQLGSGSSARGQCPPDSAADAAMDGRWPDVLDRGGSALCRVGGIGVGGVDNGGPTHLRLDLRLELWAAMVCDAVWLVCAREGCGLFAGSGRLCAVCGGRAALPRAHHRRATHTATDQAGVAPCTRARGVGVWTIGLWLWGVVCGPRRPAPPRTAATPHLPTPLVPAAACGRGRPHPLGSTMSDITRRTPGIPFFPTAPGASAGRRR